MFYTGEYSSSASEYCQMHIHLEVSLDELVELEIFIVLPKWIVQSLCNSQPPKEEEELDCHEDWIVEIQFISFPNTVPGENTMKVLYTSGHDRGTSVS